MVKNLVNRLNLNEYATKQKLKISFKKVILPLLLGLFFFSGVFQHISDSEFWPISLARLFGQFDSPHTSLYYKFFFHGLLSVPFIFKLSSVEHLIAIRVIFACIGIANLFLFYGISNKIYKDKNIALILTALLVSCLYFFSQWSRIRADFIVLFICLLGIYLKLTWSNQKLRIANLAIAPLIMILTTPKAIY